MEIEFVFDPYKNYPRPTLVWYVFLDKNEEQFAEEMKQEIALDIKEQYGGVILW